MKRNHSQALNWALAMIASGLLFCSCFRFTAHTESFRFQENLPQSAMYKEMNTITDALDGWDIAIAIWSMRNHYAGQGVGQDLYAGEIWAINKRDSTFPGTNNHYVSEMPDLPLWVNVDSLIVICDSLDERHVLYVDTAEAIKYNGDYRLGVRYPFTAMKIPASIKQIRVDFTARLYKRSGELIQEKSFSKIMYRYSAKEKGEYWGDRCG